ncbi:MAG: mycothione reductase [Microthrixaceae bacterium]
MAHFDLLIIGGGSGNSILTPEFDSWNVAMVERGPLGGTCLNVGCIPSKMLVLPAERVIEAAESAAIGVHVPEPTVDWPSIRDRIFGRIDAIVEGGTDYRRGQENVTYFEGDARFVGERRVSISLDSGGTEEVSVDRVVLAAGARPIIPDVPGLSGTPFHTSDTIMRVDRLPERLAILGGGFIAAELGHVFSALGSKVTIIHRRAQMLRHEDEEVSERFTEVFRDRVDLRLCTHPSAVSFSDGEFRIELVAEDSPTVIDVDTTTIVSDALLVTTGRQPNGVQLNVAATGVNLDSAGYVLTDRTLRTSAEGIWALGDIRNPRQLKHLANQEARVVTHNLLHPQEPISISQDVIPSAVFSHPQVGSVGEREQDLRATGRRYVVGRCDYAGVAYGWALEDSTGFAKVLIDPESLEILGGHVIGSQAATLSQQLVQAMTFGITADRLAREQIWCHPALPEVIENALLDAL